METYRFGDIASPSFGFVLWNPSADIQLEVIELRICTSSAPTNTLYTVQRITARGTATGTKTPTIDNAVGLTAAPPSGAVIDDTWSANPTADASVLARYLAVTLGDYKTFRFDPPIVTPGGQGFGVLQSFASGTYITFVWRE